MEDEDDDLGRVGWGGSPNEPEELDSDSDLGPVGWGVHNAAHRLKLVWDSEHW